jgi:hypothetical protein
MLSETLIKQASKDGGRRSRSTVKQLPDAGETGSEFWTLFSERFGPVE